MTPSQIYSWKDQKMMIRAGSTTAKEMVDSFLERIRQDNPRINALSQVLESSALAEVDLVDGGRLQGDLAGLCVVVKDMIDVASAVCDGGLGYLAGRTAHTDADIVTSLKKRGAIILGMGRSDTGGFGIQTPEVRHPAAPERIVGGSSGGCAAAVAAGFAPVALGTDSGGSIRIPAACCGIAGFKPTWGAISVRGILPFAPTLDHAGLLSGSVDDLTAVADELLTHLPKPTVTISAKDLRIGVDPRFYDEADARINQVMTDIQAVLHRAGARIVPISLPRPDAVARIHDPLVVKESMDIHGPYFDAETDLKKPVIQSCQAYYKTVTEAVYNTACWRRLEMQQKIERLFDRVHCIILPAMPCLPPRKHIPMLRLAGKKRPVDTYLRRYTCLFNVSRHPVVSLPVKAVLPGIGVSLQIAAPLNADRHLLQWVSLMNQIDFFK
jgi:aspartyl-tRNA(Asn)/glutamyl-tRNA(Gln) amidotransferase subunit A